MNLPMEKFTTLDVSAALLIDGWMTPHELTWLGLMASCHKSILELGSWKGRSTRALADNTSGMIWAIDTWKGSEEEAGKAHKEAEDLGQLKFYETHFKKNLSDHIRLSHVVPMMMTGTEAAERLLTQYGSIFDFVFIDASHTYEAVCEDIRNFRKLLRPGGLLSGHDFYAEEVNRAVKETVGLVHTYDNIWYRVE